MTFVPLTELTRKMPPAVFPCLMGLAGVALAWRTGGDLIGIGSGLHWIILTVTIILYAAMSVFYILKLIQRPGVFFEEVKTIPGRMGLAAMMLTGMLIANGLVPVAPGLATGILFVALAGHSIVALGALHNIARGGPEARQVTPVWHLTFVGFVVATHALVPLELVTLALVLFALTFMSSLAIYGLSLEQVKTWTMPVPMRPSLVIHLAPVSLFGITSVVLGLQTTSLIFGWISTVIIAVLLLRIKWLMESGFTPFWGAFTFPVAAYAGLMLLLGETVSLFHWIGVVTLIATTLYVPVIVFRLVVMCLDGRLSAATKAAEV